VVGIDNAVVARILRASRLELIARFEQFGVTVHDVIEGKCTILIDVVDGKEDSIKKHIAFLMTSEISGSPSSREILPKDVDLYYYPLP
jgi:hypothetical protein